MNYSQRHLGKRGIFQGGEVKDAAEEFPSAAFSCCGPSQ